MVAPVDVRTVDRLVSSSGGGIDELGPVRDSRAIAVRGGIAGKLRDRDILTVGGKANALDPTHRIRLLRIDPTNVAIVDHPD